jgi:hypothetical protein
MALVTLVWLFLQAMNLSNHNLAVFLSPIFHVHQARQLLLDISNYLRDLISPLF